MIPEAKPDQNEQIARLEILPITQQAIGLMYYVTPYMTITRAALHGKGIIYQGLLRSQVPAS